ncbi:phenazine biosynthesis-like protein [Aspergillus carlsbadensis]|nr:phenazine biosynthesis-like protein [Aspergillus carlsbadensis]
MASDQLSYVTLDVFTQTRFEGNQLAIVRVPKALQVNNAQKQRIAREFNFSETVFLHADSGNESPRVEIFTPVNEMEFAGHPIIGTGYLLFREAPHARKLTVRTKAGPVSLSYEPATQLVRASVPHDIHVHSKQVPTGRIQAVQGSLQHGELDLSGVEPTYPVVSMVRGVTYALVDLTKREDIFAGLVPGPSPDLDLDEGWGPSFTGTMYYRRVNSLLDAENGVMVWDLHVRMIAINLEDPACGSGGCSLGAYLALSRGQDSPVHRFNISQGSEMGRRSEIVVDVCLDESRSKITEVKLAGQAALISEGKIYVN